MKVGLKVKVGFLYSATYTANQNSALHNLGSASWLAIASGAAALCGLSILTLTKLRTYRILHQLLSLILAVLGKRAKLLTFINLAVFQCIKGPWLPVCRANCASTCIALWIQTVAVRWTACFVIDAKHNIFHTRCQMRCINDDTTLITRVRWKTQEWKITERMPSQWRLRLSRASVVLRKMFSRVFRCRIFSVSSFFQQDSDVIG